jgi:hypothetical protein
VHTFYVHTHILTHTHTYARVGCGLCLLFTIIDSPTTRPLRVTRCIADDVADHPRKHINEAIQAIDAPGVHVKGDFCELCSCQRRMNNAVRSSLDDHAEAIEEMQHYVGLLIHRVNLLSKQVEGHDRNCIKDMYAV